MTGGGWELPPELVFLTWNDDGGGILGLGREEKALFILNFLSFFLFSIEGKHLVLFMVGAYHSAEKPGILGPSYPQSSPFGSTSPKDIEH